MRKDTLLLATLLGLGGRPIRFDSPPKEAPIEKCLQCGKPKNHNNSFCSAECCKTYKLNRKK